MTSELFQKQVREMFPSEEVVIISDDKGMDASIGRVRFGGRYTESQRGLFYQDALAKLESWKAQAQGISCFGFESYPEMKKLGKV